jgi:uncharacterized protein (DUF302 family)
MQYVVETNKSVEQASTDLEAAVKKHDFGVLYVLNLRETLKKKGFDLPNECRILEICNPQQAISVLTEDMKMNMALPCRISVYEEGGKTKIGMIKPTTLLASLSQSKVLMSIAEEVERKTIQMIEEAK